MPILCFSGSIILNKWTYVRNVIKSNNDNEVTNMGEKTDKELAYAEVIMSNDNMLIIYC